MKRSFFERITGSINLKNDSLNEELVSTSNESARDTPWAQDEPEEGELAVDVYQTNDTIIIQVMVAGVGANNLSVSVTRELVTIKGKREAPQNIPRENYFHQELYWGAFARTILLPQEIEAEEVEANEHHGLLTIKLRKIDKSRVQNIKIKSL
jgi:HSP20 family protein